MVRPLLLRLLTSFRAFDFSPFSRTLWTNAFNSIRQDLTLGVGEIGEESPCPLYQWGCKKPMPPPVRAMLQV